MNITHAVDEEVVGDKLEAIFNRQKELMEKYHDIELRSGLMQTEDCPVNLDDKRGQARIKDFSWRVMEEVGEALDAYEQNDMVHFKEELIDGLHFLVELTILSGYDKLFGGSLGKINLDGLYESSKFISDKKGKIRLMEDVTNLVMDLGMMCNCLKNKPWKQTNMVTDKDNFAKQISKVWLSYVRLLSQYMDVDEITNTYLKKSQVNKFRQRSNY